MEGETSETGLVVLPASTRIRSNFGLPRKDGPVVPPCNCQSANGKAIGIR